jgi:2-keto-4-pentenoate hydratase
MSPTMSNVDAVREEIQRRPRLHSDELSIRGRDLYGETAPSAATACERTSPLSSDEVNQVVELIAGGRVERRAIDLPPGLRTRDWPSVEKVVLGLDERLGRVGSGWKIGAASEEIRRAEGLPSPSPGRFYRDTMFDNGAVLGRDLFINFRNVECEFAFELGRDFAVREEPYSEAEIAEGVHSLFPALEIGDTVFLDWYGASGYYGSCLDNGGGAAFVAGTPIDDWSSIDLARSGMDLYLNTFYIKSGVGSSAMGHPLTSLTWLVNWARSHGRSVHAGEVVSTGTCTGHCFAAPGDVVSADFGELGIVQVEFE